RELGKKGVLKFEDYVAQRHPHSKLFPYARVMVVAGGAKVPPKAFYTAEEEKQAIDLVLAKKPDAKIWHDDDNLADKEGADVLITRFKNKTQLEEAVKELESLGFQVENLFKPKQQATNGAHDGADDAEAHVMPFKIVAGEKGETVVPIESLAEVPERLRKIGQ